MRAHLSFPGAVEFDQVSTQTVTVFKGQSFGMEILPEGEDSNLRMATTSDRVLSVNEGNAPLVYVVNADNEGDSELQLQSPDRTVVFWLLIKVVTQEARSLQIPTPTVSTGS